MGGNPQQLANMSRDEGPAETVMNPLVASVRYVPLTYAIEKTLRELGGSAPLNKLLAEVWRRYVEAGNGERVVMRLYRHPTGRLWSPDAEEALHVLEAAGAVVIRGGVVYVSG